MPKIIFTSRYLRDAPPAQLENYVRYVSTREGVEMVEGSRQNLPATAQQKKLIRQIVRDIPAAKEMLEYADFLLQPTMGNATEFISCAMEQNLDLIGKRENYVDYIANRPRVERIGEHGLFTDAGTAVVLKQVQDEVVGHKGAVWTHVISLRREDAARLGYDSAEQWMALLRSKRAMLCKHMKIDSANLRWYAAFHNEGHHPHVHLMVYSAKDNDGYLTEKSIEAMRSELAHDIFRQDFAHIYEGQNQSRADLKSGAADVMQEMLEALRSGTAVNNEIEKMMVCLAGRLQNTGGKKVYGYLKRDVKNLVDQIVDELAKDPRVDALYKAWGKWQDEILLTYQKNTPPLPPLSRQQQFKSLKNMVIAEAVSLSSGNFFFDDESWQDQPEQKERGKLFPDRENLPEGEDSPDEFPEATVQTVRRITKAAQVGNVAAQYALAKLCLAGELMEKDAARAVELFTLSAEQGNEYAASRLGRLYLSGVDVPKDMEKAIHWLELSAGQGNQYAQYALGKLYLSGEEVPKDVEKAIRWLELSADQGNQYAQYALGKLYLCRQDILCDREKAVEYLQASTGQGNIYAKFLLEHLDSFKDPSVFLAATRLMHRLEKLFREDVQRATGGSPFHIDRKRRRRLAEKKQAQGHKRDDREPVQQQI